MDYRCLGHGLKVLKIKVFPLRSTLQHWLIHWVQGLGATGRGYLMVCCYTLFTLFIQSVKYSGPSIKHASVCGFYSCVCLHFLFYCVISALSFCLLSSCLPCLDWVYLLLVNLPLPLFKSLCVSICLCQFFQCFCLFVFTSILPSSVCMFQTDTLPWSPFV